MASMQFGLNLWTMRGPRVYTNIERAAFIVAGLYVFTSFAINDAVIHHLKRKRLFVSPNS